MPSSAAGVHRPAADMTGLISPSRTAKPRRRVGPGHEPRNRVPRIARCSVFKDRSAPAAAGLSAQARPPQGRPPSISATAAPARAPGCPGRPGSIAAPPSGRLAAASRRRRPRVRSAACRPGAPCRRGSPAGRSSRPPSSASPSSFTPPWLDAGAAPRCVLSPKASAISAGRWTTPPSDPARDASLLDVLRDLAPHVELVEALLGRRRRAVAVEALDEPPRELALGLARVARRRRARLAEQQPVVLAHRLVGDAHQLPEHLLRRIGDPDVVAERLAHLLHAVGPEQDRHRQDRLRRLAVGAPGRRGRRAG